MRVRRLSVVAAAVVMLAAASAHDLLPAARPGVVQLNLKVALRGEAGCGTFVDDLPPVMLVSALVPGLTPVVEICVTNVGAKTGRLTLSVIERVDADTGCSAGEEEVDASCGTGAGEISTALTQRVGSTRRCKSAGVSSVEVAFASLGPQPIMIIPELKKGMTICVALQLRYAPATPADEIALQTDTVTWRYAFDATAE